jgi:hypothetical protein
MSFQKFYVFIRNEFNVIDQGLLAIILCSLISVFVGFILYLVPGFNETGELTMTSAEAIAEWVGLVLLLRNGSIMQSKYWQYIMGCFCIILISVIFRILHYSGGIELLFVGLILLEIVYTIRFVNQRYTSASGWLKYLWICSWCAVTVGVTMKKISEMFYLLPAILFWIALILFINERMIRAKKYRGVD